MNLDKEEKINIALALIGLNIVQCGVLFNNILIMFVSFPFYIVLAYRMRNY